MSEASSAETSGLSGTVQLSWRRFLEVYEPLRPELFRYCRYLTRSPWDAEDLVQDAMARAFVTLGQLGGDPPNAKAWLLRVASNLWIDRTRRQRHEGRALTAEATPLASAPLEPRAAREAGATLLGRLSPQERAAVVLKDVFELSLEEIGEVLETTTGAVKAALHRGRGELAEPVVAELPAPRPEALDEFCRAFNARDLERLTALLLDTASVEVVGVTTRYGRRAASETVLPGMLFGSRRLAAAEREGGIHPRYVQGALPTSPRCEALQYRGEWVLLMWYAHHDGEAVRAINRVELEGGLVRRLQNYFFNPDCVGEICGELGLQFRSNGYLTSC